MFLASLKAGTEGLVHAVRETLQQHRQRRQRFQRALDFNQRNTFTDTRVSLWMCSDCNRVHTALCATPLGGPVFPACCSHERGTRKERRHATGLPQ